MKNTPQKVLLLLFALVLLGGCRETLLRGGYDDLTSSPFFLVPAGSRLTLNRSLTIPAGRVKITFQDGRQVAAPSLYRPFCRLEVLTLQDRPQQVRADTFIVSRVTRRRELAARYDNRYRYVARSAGPRWLFSGDDRPSPVIYATQLFLDSAAQADVYRLICGHLQEVHLGGRFLSVAQIRTALGDSFALQLAQK